MVYSRKVLAGAWALTALLSAVLHTPTSAADFRVTPYLQNPGSNAITVMWMAETAIDGELTYRPPRGQPIAVPSTGVQADALDYHSTEYSKFPGSIPPTLPYLHRVRLTGLAAGVAYPYSVTQGRSTYTNSFHIPAANQAVRFIVCGDPETEPESTGIFVDWPNPAGGSSRKYLLDQTDGYLANLAIMAERQPDILIIAGDLTESGGEQRDWDEFWRHNAGELSDVAGSTPIHAAPGNHDYYGGTRGGYAQPASEQSVAKFLTYFENPTNGVGTAAQQERFYRMDCGPAALIFLDVTNGDDSDSTKDTSTLLSTATGCNSPDFNPGSLQYQWLERQLADAQTNAAFTLVTFHNAPYSVGPHGSPTERQTGVPVRILTDLFLRYGVDAVFSGHDEMVEHSVVAGDEILPGGETNTYNLHFYDTGSAGDGLRGPVSGLVNDKQVFLAHTDAPEIYDGGILVEGGKHYGHLEIDVTPSGDDTWRASITPVYSLPLTDAGGSVTGFARMVYNDEVLLGEKPTKTVSMTGMFLAIR